MLFRSKGSRTDAILGHLADQGPLPPKQPGEQRDQNDQRAENEWGESGDEIGSGCHGCDTRRLRVDCGEIRPGTQRASGTRVVLARPLAGAYSMLDSSARTAAAASGSPCRAALRYQRSALSWSFSTPTPYR